MSEIMLAKQFIDRLQRNSYYVNITRLSLSGFDLLDLPLLEMPQLQQLNISHNKIHSLASFRNCHRLTDLNLGHNQICSLDELEYLKDAKSLTCLCLENNPCSELFQLPQEYSDACTSSYPSSARNPEQRSLEWETDGQSVATLLPNEVASSPRCESAPRQIQEGILSPCSPCLPVEVPENSFSRHIEPAQELLYNNGNGQEASDAAAWIYPNNDEGFRDPERSIQWGANERTGSEISFPGHTEPAQELLYNNGNGQEASDAAAWIYPNNAEGFRDPERSIQWGANETTGSEISFPGHIEPAQEPWYNNGNGCTTASSTACVAAVTSYPERQEDIDAAGWIYPNNAEGFRDSEYRPSGREVPENSFPRRIEPAQEPWYNNGNGLTTARNRGIASSTAYMAADTRYPERREDSYTAGWIYPNNTEGFNDPEYLPSDRGLRRSIQSGAIEGTGSVRRQTQERICYCSSRQPELVPENSFPRHIEPAQEPWYNYGNRQDIDAAAWIYPNNAEGFRDPEYRPSSRYSRQSIQERIRQRIRPRQPELVPENSSWSGRSTARAGGVAPVWHPERQQVREIYPYTAEEVHELEQQRREQNVNLLSVILALIREMDAFSLGVLCHLIDDLLRYR